MTEFIAYMIMPFARPDDEFIDDARLFGNVLHRLRVPSRVAEAADLLDQGAVIEGYEYLSEALIGSRTTGPVRVQSHNTHSC